MVSGNRNNRYTPKQALQKICDICEEEYGKGKRKININLIWNIADDGLNYQYDTSTKPGLNFGDTCL